MARTDPEFFPSLGYFLMSFFYSGTTNIHIQSRELSGAIVALVGPVLPESLKKRLYRRELFLLVIFITYCLHA
jgi:hypothetical protein